MDSTAGDENLPKTYYESKKYALLLCLVFLIGLVIQVVVELGDFPGQFSFLLFYYLALVVVIGLLFWIYPIAKLTIYTDHFEFQKGRFSLVAQWSEVKYISLSIKDKATLFIETEHGTTKLIDTRILKIKDGKNFRSVSKEEIIKALQSLSGKEVIFGDISLAQNKKLVTFLVIVVVIIFSFIFIRFT